MHFQAAARRLGRFQQPEPAQQQRGAGADCGE